MIKAVSSQVVNFNTTISIVDETNNNLETSVVQLTASLDTSSFNYEEHVNVLNKELYVANAAEIKSRYATFKQQVIATASALGYVLF